MDDCWFCVFVLTIFTWVSLRHPDNETSSFHFTECLVDKLSTLFLPKSSRTSIRLVACCFLMLCVSLDQMVFLILDYLNMGFCKWGFSAFGWWCRPFSFKRRACQWIRVMTLSVNSGYFIAYQMSLFPVKGKAFPLRELANIFRSASNSSIFMLSFLSGTLRSKSNSSSRPEKGDT